MFKLAVLAVVLVAFAVNCEPGDGKDKCMKVFRPNSDKPSPTFAVKCCKGLSLSEYREGVESCKPDHPPPEGKGDKMDKPLGPPPCDIDNCIAKKMGYLAEDGKSINKEALIAYLKEQDNPELAAVIQKNCVEGDLDLYGPKDFCETIKLRHCAQLQLMKSCKDWDTEGECPEMKAQLDECAAAIGV